MHDDKKNRLGYDEDFYRLSSLCDDTFEIKKKFAIDSIALENSASLKNKDSSSNDQEER